MVGKVIKLRVSRNWTEIAIGQKEKIHEWSRACAKLTVRWKQVEKEASDFSLFDWAWDEELHFIMMTCYELWIGKSK